MNGLAIKVGDRVRLEEEFERSSGDIIPMGTVFRVDHIFLDSSMEVSWGNDTCVIPARMVVNLNLNAVELRKGARLRRGR